MCTFALKVQCKVIQFLPVRWSWYKANALCKISIVHYASDEKVGTTTELYAKSEGEINSAPRFAILLLAECSYTQLASSQFKLKNTQMRMEYTDSYDVISVLPKQPPSNEL